MKRSVLLVSILIGLYACKGKMFEQPTAAMEETIMTGESFFVTDADNFERNDIVLFKYWGDDYFRPNVETGKYEKTWQNWLKRLIAISGDSLEIKDTDVYINGKKIPLPPAALVEYDIYSLVALNDLPVREEWETHAMQMKGDTFHYMALLTKSKADEYKRRKGVLRLEERIVPGTEMDTMLARSCSDCLWTIDNYGPLKIPSPGDTIDVTSANFKLYQNIPGIQFGKQLVKEKLYFVMGDNRHQSMDSRYIGFISHSKMVGIVK